MQRDLWKGETRQSNAVSDLGMVFQDANLFPWLTIEENVALPLELKRTPKKQRLSRARALTDLVGISGFETRWPYELSGGMGLNGGLHDAFELLAALRDIRAGAPSPQRLDLYERRRRPVALEQIIAQADANRARMRERDPAKRREILADLQAIAADRERHEAHLLRTSMIAGLRQAASVS